MIIQTGMRTDIPAFYSDWFVNRLKAGFVLVRNPYNPEQITKYRLDPKVVDIIAFCTKNPLPMLGKMEYLKPYGQYWFVTITPYGKEIEPFVPDKRKVLDSFKKLSSAIGKDSMGWRYDPIFLNQKYTKEYHINAFGEMAKVLSGYTDTCVISFIDIYKKVERNFPEVKAVSRTDMLEITKAFVTIGREYNITIKPCAEEDFPGDIGADLSGCLNKDVYEKTLGVTLKLPKEHSQRPACGCFLAHDIGAYNTCGHLCRYCYANYDADTVRRNMRLHDKSSPLLLGDVGPNDKIRDAKQSSWVDVQLSFDW